MMMLIQRQVGCGSMGSTLYGYNGQCCAGGHQQYAAEADTTSD